MPNQQLARGLWAQFATQENPFGVANGMEENLRHIDDHLALYTLLPPQAPGTPLPAGAIDGDGQAYTDGSYATFNGGTWRTYAPRRGIRVVFADGTDSWLNTGTGWERFSVVDTGPAVQAAVAAATGVAQSEITPLMQEAQAARDEAVPAASAAQAARTGAEAARDAAQLSAGVYATTADGLAATTSGRYFSVPSAASSEYLILYMNSGGSAVEQKRYPSTGGVESGVAGIYTNIGVNSVSKNDTGSGVTTMMRDANGNLRVVELPGDGVKDPIYYGMVPNSYKNPEFGISTAKYYETVCDPDRVEMVRDVNGNLRVLSAIGSSVEGACVFGAQSSNVDLQATPTEFVVFVTAGQSNMQGIGNSLTSETVKAGIAYQYYNNALTQISGDPVGNASTGSSLPSFANEFFRRTGLGVIFIPCAVGGSGLTATAALPENGGDGQNWDVTGTLRTTLASRYNDAVSALNSSGLAWRFGGLLWSQGERDARCLPSAGNKITAADYMTAFDNLRSYLNTTFGSTKWSWIISQTGGDSAGIDAAGLAEMREIQRSIVKTRANTYFGWTGAYNLIARNLMRSIDFPSDPLDSNRSHYSQAGYSEMGKAMATAAAFISIGNA